jgi:hypothetical protein
MDPTEGKKGPDGQVPVRRAVNKLVANEDLIFLEDQEDFLAQGEPAVSVFEHRSRVPAERPQGRRFCGSKAVGEAVAEKGRRPVAAMIGILQFREQDVTARRRLQICRQKTVVLPCMAVQECTGGKTALAVGLQPFQAEKGVMGKGGDVLQRRRRHGGPLRVAG